MGKWFSEFNDEQRNIFLKDLLVSNLFCLLYAFFLHFFFYKHLCWNKYICYFLKYFSEYLDSFFFRSDNEPQLLCFYLHYCMLISQMEFILAFQ